MNEQTVKIGITADESIRMRLVSHEPRCEVCYRQCHAAWHQVARAELNPIALIQFVERLDAGHVLSKAIVGWVLAVTGIDEAKMRAALELEQCHGADGEQAGREGD